MMILDENVFADEKLLLEDEAVVLTDKEIFTNIWQSPRIVFKYLNDNQYDKFVFILLFLSGTFGAFDNAITKHMGDSLAIWGILGICILLGGLAGIFFIYFYAALITWTGNWFGGSGNIKSLLRVSAHAGTPQIVGLLLLLLQTFMFGNSIFKSSFNFLDMEVFARTVFIFFILSKFCLSVWSIVLIVIGVSEVQKFSIGKAVLNVILPVLLIIFLLMMIGVFMRLMR